VHTNRLHPLLSVTLPSRSTLLLRFLC
jgi:hypothetical protein